MRPATLIGFFFLLVAATVAAFVHDFKSQRKHDEQAEQVQRLLGGLGFGAAVDLGTCPFSFDPRLGCRCAADQSPIPGGAWFCPRHACSVFYYPPLDGMAASPRGESNFVESGNAKTF